MNMLQSFVSSGTAKLLSQVIAGSDIDRAKALTAAAISALYVSPTMTFVYGTLLPWARRQGGHMAFWLTDQLAVPLYLNFTIVFANLLLGAHFGLFDAFYATLAKLPKAMLSGWAFWGPARARESLQTAWLARLLCLKADRSIR